MLESHEPEVENEPVDGEETSGWEVAMGGGRTGGSLETVERSIHTVLICLWPN